MREEFKESDKKILEQRSGSICSYPGCGALTRASNQEAPDKTSSTGMACHIYAASSKNAKRIKPEDLDIDLSDISNGIWMCYTHGKLIDTDEDRYTPKMLKEWKETNESIATLRQSMSISYEEACKKINFTDSINTEVILPFGSDLNMYVGDALEHSYLSVIWGDEKTGIFRDFIIEHVLNAQSHGKATEVKLNITQNVIEIIDNGIPFNVRDLLNKPNKGGAGILQHIMDNYGTDVFLSSYFLNDVNILKLALPNKVEEVTSGNGCCVSLSMDSILSGENSTYSIHEYCNEVFVVLPTYFGPSNCYSLLELNTASLGDEKRQIVFVANKISDYVINKLLSMFKNCQILILKE